MQEESQEPAEEVPKLRWWQRNRWLGVALVLLFTGFAPAPPQLPPLPPDEEQQVDDDPLDDPPDFDFLKKR